MEHKVESELEKKQYGSGSETESEKNKSGSETESEPGSESGSESGSEPGSESESESESESKGAETELRLHKYINQTFEEYIVLEVICHVITIYIIAISILYIYVNMFKE